ncbi:uncharacterized protein TRAVEDRAFT_164517 [Trametes versicolor FP-101664 SS1]|uniref:uncharacterized protein n=1 Tax=Trametes versicolor (strain FP-101664) TaxID=717944 RepID=UPI0004622F93|nr:uncharacterized protein TRAVEDRAFT_164517 [Trametes versicolor FP-101664 SS1]EIW60066.1 hypothetical protein TRAVEDRAFT_164517 [Trametes versicolor FP-101664 SS1]
MPAGLKRTYSTRAAKPAPPSSPPSELTSPPPLKRKRPLADRLTGTNTPSKKPRRALGASTSKAKAGDTSAATKPKQGKLTQLHFSLDTPTLRTCPLCDLSYTRGAPDDETLHKAHCARVQRGLEWGREEQREAEKAGVEELESSVKLPNGARGRIVCFRPDVGGKIGAKLAILLDTIRLALSSPPLSPAVLQRSKIYLFLLSTPGTTTTREKIVGCVVAQRISTAMAIANPAELSQSSSQTSSQESSATASLPSSQSESLSASLSTSSPAPALLPVDSASNLYVHPAPLSTPLGIPRLFVSSAHRRLGIASRLLSVAAQTFILGCPLDPARGEVAFTQPTGAGKAVLETWGRGGVRIYEEEQNM